MERDRAVLERILALLLALAALADRAVGLPILKRLQLLTMLGRGEAEARSLIVVMASGLPAAAVATPTLAGDARRLAASFRILALLLDGLLAQVRGELLSRNASPQTGAPEPNPRGPEGGRATPASPAPDTS